MIEPMKRHGAVMDLNVITGLLVIRAKLAQPRRLILFRTAD